MTACFLASPGSIKVIRKLEESGYEAVFVGGAVRDYLLGKPATDFDIATSAAPLDIKNVFKQTIDIGIEHGTILVLIDDEPVEVTTYRTGNTLRDDLGHRDFTINALALTKDETLIDLVNGQQDLKDGIIRAVASPGERFTEDPLRMLRALRFASVLDFTIEKRTFDAIQAEYKRLTSVSIERIKTEFDKLFTGVNPLKGLQLLADSKLSEALPLFPKTIGKMPPFHSSKEGWAALMMTGDFTAAELGNAYKLSNDEKKFLQCIQKAYAIRRRRSFQKDEFYLFEVDVLSYVEKFHCTVAGMTEELGQADFMRMKTLLPIQSKADLFVSGKDLIRLAGGKGGRWVGEWIEKIEYAVLHGHLENDPDTIKEWFINDFDGER